MAPVLSKTDINAVFILFNIFFERNNILFPYEHASNLNEINRLIENNSQFKIILVGKVEDIQQIINSICLHYIDCIYVLSNGTKLNINNKNVIYATDERILLLNLMFLTVNYTHKEQIIQKSLGNNGLSDQYAWHVLELLDDIDRI
ncbi:hypothetical protein I4U23_015606 [Adineta vaga]|nr:hypothetical protein I4U23_015606 [Adineta vaga]